MPHTQRGSTLIEATWALLICIVILLASVTFVANSLQGTHHTRDKMFAVQKAIGLLEELKGIVERKTGGDVNLLDGYDDGAERNPLLTTQTGIDDPAHPASGNSYSGSEWRFTRQISVTKLLSLQTSDIRLVTVRVFARETPEAEPSVLAEVAGIIRTIADRYPPTEVYDVYCIATAQVPGWWVYMANLVPFVQNAIADLQARNPGLEFRTHWIRNLAYGRDPEYVPYINKTADSNADINKVYFYPGQMPSGSGVNFYYVPTQFGGRIRVDSAVVNDYDAANNPVPYSIADQYNNALRYPDELALWQQRMAAGKETEPTLRLLIDDMYLNPQNYENAILVNLHGELLPFPPVRNYSDPAKDPEGHSNVRVVTHAERLQYDTDDTAQRDVRLRVYSWLANPDLGTVSILDEPISLFIPDVDVSADATVTAISGGVDGNLDSVTDVYARGAAATSSATSTMYYESAFIAGQGTVIRLYNSPLRSPPLTCASGQSQGLESDRRLYGMEYIPAPIVAGASGDPFSRDLADCTVPATKNTARWLITLPAAALTGGTRYTIETRIGYVDPANPGTVTGVLFPSRNEPQNISRTYVYYGNDLWAFGDGTSANRPHIPLTEMYQYIGDPRHLPYLDLKDAFDATEAPLGGGYNRYFSNFGGASYTGTDWWPGWSMANGWASGGATPDRFIEVDVNRMLSALRFSLLRTRSLWTTLTGYSYYYIGLGNEIGYDSANGFPNSISTSAMPFTGASGSRWEQSITSSASTGVKMIKEATSTAPWWAVTWLGELWPDDRYTAEWRASGNLPTGSGTGRYVRVLRTSITNRLPTGTTFFNATRCTADRGSTALFQIGTTTSTFHHEYTNGQTGTLLTDGQEVSNSYHFLVPTTAAISRPFNTDRNGAVPSDFLSQMWYPGTLTTTALATYYGHQTAGLVGSQLLALRGSQASDQTFIVVNGLDRTVQTGSAFLGRWSFLTLVHSFLAAGLDANAPVQQVPRIRITEPDDMTNLADPSAIDVRFKQDWRRWDGERYTQAYSDAFTDAGTLSFAIRYSSDAGRTWRYVQDRTAGVPGVRPDDSHIATVAWDGAAEEYTFSWNVPSASYPPGSYILLVEAYRDGKALHYSYHKQKIYIKR